MFLNQWMHACMHAKSIQSCPTLYDSRHYSPPGFSVCGISQARILEWVVISFSWGSSQPHVSYISTHVSYISFIGRRVLYHQRYLEAWCLCVTKQTQKSPGLNVKYKKGPEYGSLVLARLRTVQTDCTDCENCGYFVHGTFPFHALSAMKGHILLSAHFLFYFK